MTDRKWTPGPWALIRRDNAISTPSRYVVANGEEIMGDEPYYPWCPEKDADWHLITAAPDLYEALDRAARWIESGHDGVKPLLRECHAALAKARGEA